MAPTLCYACGKPLDPTDHHYRTEEIPIRSDVPVRYWCNQHKCHDKLASYFDNGHSTREGDVIRVKRIA